MELNKRVKELMDNCKVMSIEDVPNITKVIYEDDGTQTLTRNDDYHKLIISYKYDNKQKNNR